MAGWEGVSGRGGGRRGSRVFVIWVPQSTNIVGFSVIWIVAFAYVTAMDGSLEGPPSTGPMQ